MMRSPRSWHFFFLILPYGASFGFVSALPYLALRRGIPVEAIGAVVAAAFVPHALKFVWSPLVDVTWTRKGWYVAALALVSAGTIASMTMPIGPSSLGPLTAVVVTSQISLTLMGMACEAMIGQGVPTARKGASAGWFQAGIFFGLGIGGGGAIELIARFGGPAAGAIIGVSLLGCALPLLWFDEPPNAHRRRLGDALRWLWRDLWGLARSRGGIAALFICLSPIGSGAAGNLFGALADEWHASLDLVALTTGALGGIVSALGAAGGGWLAARIGRREAYALAGAFTAATAIVMAVAPHEAWGFGICTLTYQAFNGAAFAAFSAFAFEIAGTEGVATKYNVLASLVNASIAYMTRIDSAAHARWGGDGVLLGDAAMTGAGIAVLAVGLALRQRTESA